MKLKIWTGAMLASILLAAHSGAVETGRIKGRVVDAAAGNPVTGALVVVDGTRFTATTDANGTFTIINIPEGAYLVHVEMGLVRSTLQRVAIAVGKTTTVNFTLATAQLPRTESKVKTSKDEASKTHTTDRAAAAPEATDARSAKRQDIGRAQESLQYSPHTYSPQPYTPPYFDQESYDTIEENGWQSTDDRPLSTFSVDVDAASYSNMRRFITQGQLPPVDAVRIEELINYFDYDYPDPRGQHPFSITTEVADSPWNPGLKLVHIGLQGKRLDIDRLPPANLVFLIDVSGSMNQPDKLPLLKSSFRMLVDQLREEDEIAIVVYAGAAGLVLPPTSGADKDTILDAISRLEAGGSTAGAAGIQLAYDIAQRNFIRNGNNRVILATDGDFNVGVSSDGALVRLIEQKRKSGVFLTVLGFGEGNLKDSKMEKIADAGNGHYAYIDNLMEGRKVMVSEIGATLLTIAKDVKLQVEFNPARVASYRLVGYENRMLRDRDFDDDRKDAGEIGAGHSVTALYEIELTDHDRGNGRTRKYKSPVPNDETRRSAELLTVSFRYKRPNESQSRLLAVAVQDRNTRFARASDNFRFSAAVAEFGMLLRNSEHMGNASIEHVIRTARAARGEDEQRLREEFVSLAEMTSTLLQPEEVGWR